MGNHFTPEDAIEFGNELLENISEIKDLCDEEEYGDNTEAAEEFADNTKKVVTGIVEWIDENNYVTEKQETSLRNISGGAEHWLNR